MKTKTLAACALALLSPLAFAAGELKAVACLYELQAETYRFARLQMEIGASTNPALAGKLRTQIKAATQELFLNVQEAKPGMVAAGLQRQYDQLNDEVAGYVTEAISSGNSKGVAALRTKQTSLLKLLEDDGKLLQKSSGPATQGLALIGSTKVNVERLAYDFEFCDKNCAQQLPPEIAEIEKGLESMRTTQAKYFSQGNYDLAKSQAVFLRMAVDSRAKGTVVTDAAQSNVIVTATHLWEIIDKVLDGYIDKAGG